MFHKRVAILMLYLVLGKDHRGTHNRNHARWCVVTGLLLTEQPAPEYNYTDNNLVISYCVMSHLFKINF